MITIGILGLGEVGQAIKKLAHKHYQIYGRDLKFDEINSHPIHILHICIPYTHKFTSTVVATIKELRPKLVVIDATVKPGTSRKIYHQTKTPIVHAPIMGVHPHLAKYQKTFTKAIGAINDSAFRLAALHFKKMGIKKIIRFDRPEETELAKIMCTTYYGWNIVFNKLVKYICDQTKTNYDQVYRQFNHIYNQGYARTKPHVRRPILDYVPGPIGGHCVIPNAKILADFSPTTITKTLLSLDHQLQHEAREK